MIGKQAQQARVIFRKTAGFVHHVQCANHLVMDEKGNCREGFQVWVRLEELG